MSYYCFTNMDLVGGFIPLENLFLKKRVSGQHFLAFVYQQNGEFGL